MEMPLVCLSAFFIYERLIPPQECRNFLPSYAYTPNHVEDTYGLFFNGFMCIHTHMGSPVRSE